MTLGDYWGLTAEEKYYNPAGVSLIIERTLQGRKLLHMLNRHDFYLHRTDLKTALLYNHMSFRSIARAEDSVTFEEIFRKDGLKQACTVFAEEQDRRRKELAKILSSGRRVALWGVGGAAETLFDKLDMKGWNIRYVFDSSKLKIGKTFRGFRVQDIHDIASLAAEIDLIAICISTVPEKELENTLSAYGWNGEIFNCGRLRYD